jgi:hypothetical protein
MDTIKRTPEENHTDALADFRDHLKAARKHATKGKEHAEEMAWKLKMVLKALPDDAAIRGFDETALLATTAGEIDASYKSADDAEDLSRAIKRPISELLGALDNANGLHGYLTAGQFSDEE